MSFTTWLRTTSMTDIAALVNQVVVVGIAIVLTRYCGLLLLTDSVAYIETLSDREVDPNLLLSMANAYITGRQGTGINLAYVIAGLLGVKLLATGGAHVANRFSSRERYEAMERGRAAGAAQALVLEETASDRRAERRNHTQEQPAVAIDADQVDLTVAPREAVEPARPARAAKPGQVVLPADDESGS